MQSNFVNTGNVIDRGMSQADGSSRPPEYCFVSISSIKDLFSADFVTSYPLSLPSSGSTVGEEHRTLSSYGKKELCKKNPKRQRNTTSLLVPTATRIVDSRASNDQLTRHALKLQRGRNRKSSVSQLNAPKQHNEAKNYHPQTSKIAQRLPSVETPFHLSCNNDQLLSRKEFLFVQNAYNQMEERVHNFDRTFSEYLNGGNYQDNFLELKKSVITMLCTSQEKFDDMITKYYSMQGNNSHSQSQERFRKRLRELYRLILISNTHGFIGLTSMSDLAGQVEGSSRCSVEENLTTTLCDGNCGFSRLKEELEEAAVEIKGINDRIFSGIQWIHAQCPSAPKSKESHLMCIKLGLNIAEQLMAACNYRATMRFFFAWRLHSQLCYNKLKVQKFKRIFSQSKLWRILSFRRADILRKRFKIWRIFIKMKRKEERVASSLEIQRVWHGFVRRKYVRMIRIVKLASKLQCNVRVYLLRHLLSQKRIEQRQRDVTIAFQREARRFLVLQSFERLIKKNSTAVILQVMIRSSLSKNILIFKQRQWVLNQRLNSALLLQKVLRRHSAVCIKHALRLIGKAILVQCLWRSYIGRKGFMIVRGAITVQKWARKLLSQKEREKRIFIFAMRIQNVLRSYAAFMIRNAKCKLNAAGKIQDFMVCALAIKKIQRKKDDNAARIVQRCMKRYHFIVIRLKRELSSRDIQSMIRSWKARINLKKKNEEKIRAVLLLHLKRKKLLNEAVFMLQKRFRILEAVNLRRMKMLSLLLQNLSRCFLAKRYLNRAKIIDASLRFCAACKIQHISGRFQYLKLQKLAISQQKESASIMMQRYFRRMISMNKIKTDLLHKRKESMRLKAAATRIQSTCRSSLAGTAVTKLRNWRAKELVERKAFLLTKVQSCYRQKLTKAFTCKLRQQRCASSASQIQNFVRQKLARRIALDLRREENIKRIEKVKQATVITQCWWRSRIARRRLRKASYQLKVFRKTFSLLETAGENARVPYKVLTSEVSKHAESNQEGQNFYSTPPLMEHVQKAMVEDRVDTASSLSPPSEAPVTSDWLGQIAPEGQNFYSTPPLMLHGQNSRVEERNDVACSSLPRSEPPKTSDWLGQFMKDVNGNPLSKEASRNFMLSDQVSDPKSIRKKCATNKN